MDLDRRITNAAERYRRGKPITISFDGRAYRAFEGEPVAVALFASGAEVLTRSVKYHRPRAFFCLDGHCASCLLRVDDLPNMRSCVSACADELEVKSQNAFPGSDLDLLGAVDWLFPEGMDHHTLMTKSTLVNQVMQKIVRQLSGLGKAPTRVARELPAARTERVDVAVVGGGPAGLAAARVAAAAGARTFLVDEQAEPGGQLLTHPAHGLADATARADAARAAGATLLASSPAIAWFGEDEGGELGVATPDGLLKLRATRIVYATGGYDQMLPFEDNDRPGVFSARAIGRLVVRWGVRPGRHVALVGAEPWLATLADELARVGVEAVRVDPAVTPPVRVKGRAWVEGLIVDDGGKERTIPCDAIGLGGPPAPASEIVRQHGAMVRLDRAAGGFAVTVDGYGRTSAPGVFACGDVTGRRTIEESTDAGARAGAVAASEARA